jgi:hypothetical protein
MARGHPMPELTLTLDERDTLERWARRPTTAQALAQRARMILACAEGRPNQHVARLERVTRQTVGRWRGRFVSRRLDGLLDEPRTGAPRQIMSRWSAWCGGRWRRRRGTPRIGAPGRWRHAAA